MLSENLRSVIRKLVDQESFSNNGAHYSTAVKVVEYRLGEYLKYKTGAERLAWLKTIVFDVCHRGVSYTKYESKRRRQLKQTTEQLKQAKILLRALKHFIN
ncbi:MAG: hypothetical protein J6R99_01825 [Alphaproteobacteria bacterium]|nr:hypothetical protein [Alphaproteobacteria bacterium]